MNNCYHIENVEVKNVWLLNDSKDRIESSSTIPLDVKVKFLQSSKNLVTCGTLAVAKIGANNFESLLVLGESSTTIVSM